MNNFIKKIFGIAVSLIFPDKSESVVGIDIGSSFLKIIQLYYKIKHGDGSTFPGGDQRRL